MLYTKLNDKKALIWRIVHRDNLGWILTQGLHCGNSATKSSTWVSIGNDDLINRRGRHNVPSHPYGVLNDYVPFYFTPFSPMLYNIHTGRGGITQRANDEIVILVSSLHKLANLNVPFLFTDRHAYCQLASYYSTLADLHHIDWQLLQRRDFKRDPNDPAKLERYQAEALIYQHLPVTGLLGIVCHTDQLKQSIEQQVRGCHLQLSVHARPNWYF